MKFKEALKLDDKDIKSNRIDIVNGDLKTSYSRCIEDIKVRITKLEAEREDMLDMSSDFKDTINLDKFNAVSFVNDDLNKAIAIRELKENLVLIEERYAELF